MCIRRPLAPALGNRLLRGWHTPQISKTVGRPQQILAIRGKGQADTELAFGHIPGSRLQSDVRIALVVEGIVYDRSQQPAVAHAPDPYSAPTRSDCQQHVV